MSSAVEPIDPNPVDTEAMGRRILEQAFEIWINPEIERRRTEGNLTDEFVLRAAQRLQRPDGVNEVRINEEVRGIAFVRDVSDRGLGDPVYYSDLNELETFDLLEEDLDCGHWTVIWTGTRWLTSFNFLSNRGRCLDLLGKARQFLEAACAARDLGHAAVAVDTLFSACELASKAELVASHLLELDTRKHAAIATKLNSWRKLGNIDGAFVDLFNRLGRIRGLYRYDPGQSEAMPVTQDDLDVVDQVISSATSRVAPLAPERERRGDAPAAALERPRDR